METGEFKENDVEFVICKLGTGDMIKRLASGELDIAICVTEGLVAGIAGNKDLRLFGTYVDSALPWAISVATDAKYSSIDDLAFGARFGISRAGSGSEVMAKYMASAYEWKVQPSMVVLGDVHGLVKGVQEGNADAFMWERTTMQRHYAANEVRYLGTVRPPWPAFSLGATAQFVSGNGDRIKNLLAAMGRVEHAFMDNAWADQRTQYVCSKLGYSPDDAQQWAAYVRYNESGAVDESKVKAVVDALTRAGVMDQCQVSDVVQLP
ncbi:hypothetical protein EV179_002548 [Coemansia sp. RSA 487]|nr:hypothetical protein LPJ74_003941 [Coemansia sp. RSA 1843]KAJ2085997.1 hypothetical protein IW138_005983 [Coemansia sp. RSA 986]KAJ2215018.1 hypothetical protein EV179_002548 [Coemansia sp. RSA 487]